MTGARWAQFLAAVNKQAEAGGKALDTAKAIMKSDPPPAAAYLAARTALTEAAKENKLEETISSYKELNRQNESILTLGDNFPDLKTNDAYLRLIEEFKNAVNVTTAARKEYGQSVAAYNESLVRLPFSLVA